MFAYFSLKGPYLSLHVSQEDYPGRVHYNDNKHAKIYNLTATEQEKNKERGRRTDRKRRTRQTRRARQNKDTGRGEGEEKEK